MDLTSEYREWFDAKHYNSLAKELRETRELLKTEGAKVDEELSADFVDSVLDVVVVRFAARFEKDNPRFEKLRWFAACGVPIETINEWIEVK